MTHINELMQRLLEQGTLTREESCQLLISITQGEITPEVAAAILTCIQMRGVAADELLGLRDGILQTGVPATLQADRFIDVVGTGGDRKNTFNISTTSCFVIAGAGYKVVKHGNNASTSVSGASNVIAGHGVKFTNDLPTLQRSLDECGFVYLHAPLFASAMKHVAPIRRALPFPTCFNLLGPLVNPACPPCQMLGVATLGQMRIYHHVYERLGIDYGIIHSTDGYDEISLTGDFKVITRTDERVYSPQDLGLSPVAPSSIYGGDTPQEAMRIMDNILAGNATPSQQSVVETNAAFAIYVMEQGKKDILDCLATARESIQSGRAQKVLERYVQLNS